MRFDPSGPLKGTVRAPGDKSLSHRAALFGAMCADPVHVTGYLDAADTRSTWAVKPTMSVSISAARTVRSSSAWIGPPVARRSASSRDT